MKSIPIIFAIVLAAEIFYLGWYLSERRFVGQDKTFTTVTEHDVAPDVPLKPVTRPLKPIVRKSADSIRAKQLMDSLQRCYKDSLSVMQELARRATQSFTWDLIDTTMCLHLTIDPFSRRATLDSSWIRPVKCFDTLKTEIKYMPVDRAWYENPIFLIPAALYIGYELGRGR